MRNNLNCTWAYDLHLALSLHKCYNGNRMSKKVGRPIEYTPERIAEIKALMEEYIETHTIPILAEFAYLNNIRRQTFYEIPELSDTVEKLLLKKEAQLEAGGLAEKINVSMAKFSLAQLGWSDKQEIKGEKPLNIKIEWNKES